MRVPPAISDDKISDFPKFCLTLPPNRPYISPIPSLVEGRWPSSRTLGRDAVDVAASGACRVGRAGFGPWANTARRRPAPMPGWTWVRRRAVPGEAFWRRREAAYGKTVWSWHPLLVSSWRRRVDPTGF